MKKRLSKTFSASNSDYLTTRFSDFINENQNIEIEHMCAFSTDRTNYIIITYFAYFEKEKE